MPLELVTEVDVYSLSVGFNRGLSRLFLGGVLYQFPLCISLSLCFCIVTKKGSISVSGQLLTYPSPNPTLTLSCYQLTVVELGEG